MVYQHGKAALTHMQVSRFACPAPDLQIGIASSGIFL